ncbi:hypothetical protein E4T56_gene10383 [Termitomyces sp. T112]|nr:hypothetical protein E4T56_gene10383 [Termitomyces sp. T112]
MDTTSGIAKLSDIEYARRFNEPSGHDPRTETPAYMAVEYQFQRHLFYPALSLQEIEDTCASHSEKDRFFTFNFYHDLESNRTPYPLRPRTNCVFSDNRNLINIVNSLSTIYGKYDYLIGATLFAVELVNAYKEIEATEPIKINGIPSHWNETRFENKIYDAITKRFNDILSSRMPEGANVQVKPLLPSEINPPQTSKIKGKARDLGDVAVYEDIWRWRRLRYHLANPRPRKPRREAVCRRIKGRRGKSIERLMEIRRQS